MSPTPARYRPAVLIPWLWVGLVTVSVAATMLSRPEWWTWIAPEASLAREINTAMLLATAAVAAWIWWRRGGLSDQTWSDWPLLFLTIGFVGLAADERVAIHERLRDRVLAPRGVSLPFVPWGEPGDVVLVVVAIVGLALLGPVLRVVADDPVALRWFVAGVILAVVAVALDTLPIESYQLRNEIRFQSGEEAVELAGAACFLSAMLHLASRRPVAYG